MSKRNSLLGGLKIPNYLLQYYTSILQGTFFIKYVNEKERMKSKYGKYLFPAEELTILEHDPDVVSPTVQT